MIPLARDPALDAAYRATRYVVGLPAGEVIVRIGETSAALDRWLAAEGATVWAWLTADNPGSRRLPEAENAIRRAALDDALARAGWRGCRARAVPDDPAWPEEHGVLVPGLPRDAACGLAASFGQLAIVCGRHGAAPELAWIPEFP